jgi:asparagine synthase (glutamine-hydrolysing)
LLGKYIKNNCDTKVIFKGDGAYKLFENNLNTNTNTNTIEYDNNTKSIIQDMHLYDLLGCEKCLTTHGLEVKIPFLDKCFVNFYLSIPASIRKNLTIDKFLLSNSFLDLLSDEILYMKKENNYDLYTYIQEYTDTLFKTDELSSSEEKYYKHIYKLYYDKN